MPPATMRHSGGMDAGILHTEVDRTFKEMKGLRLVVKLVLLTGWVGGGERGENEEGGGRKA